MRKFTLMLVAAALAALVSGGAMGQDEKKNKQPGGGRGMGGGFGADVFAMVGTNKVLQDELKITDDQKTKLEAHAKESREKMAESMKGVNFREMTDEQRKEMTEKMTKAREENKKKIEGLLTSEQAKRANQLNYQVMGVRAFSNKDVVAALKIGDDQQEKIKTISEAAQKDSRELMGNRAGGPPSDEDRKKMQDNMKKVEAIRKDAEEKIVATLSDDQKKAWKDLTGEKFDVSKLQGGGRPQRNDQ